MDIFSSSLHFPFKPQVLYTYISVMIRIKASMRKKYMYGWTYIHCTLAFVRCFDVILLNVKFHWLRPDDSIEQNIRSQMLWFIMEFCNWKISIGGNRTNSMRMHHSRGLNSLLISTQWILYLSMLRIFSKWSHKRALD